MKACPYCAEDIQDAAIVCKHCGRELTAKSRFWFATPAIVLGLIGLAYFAFIFDVSVATEHTTIGGVDIPSQRVVNLGLMADRQTGLLVSAVLLLIGVVLAIANRARGGAASASMHEPAAAAVRTPEEAAHADRIEKRVRIAVAMGVIGVIGVIAFAMWALN